MAIASLAGLIDQVSRSQLLPEEQQRELAGPLQECHARQLGHLTDEQRRELIELLRAARAPHEEPDSDWR